MKVRGCCVGNTNCGRCCGSDVGGGDYCGGGAGGGELLRQWKLEVRVVATMKVGGESCYDGESWRCDA